MGKNVKISPRLNQSLLTSLTTSLLLSNLLLRQPHSIWCSAGPISMEIIQQIFWGKAKSNANASGILDASWDFGWYVMHLCKCPDLRRLEDASYEKYFFLRIGGLVVGLHLTQCVYVLQNVSFCKNTRAIRKKQCKNYNLNLFTTCNLVQCVQFVIVVIVDRSKCRSIL